MRVPSMECLDDMQMEEVGRYLELHAPKYGINCVNWKDSFSYHPITVVTIAHSQKYLYIDYFVRCNYLRPSIMKTTKT